MAKPFTSRDGADPSGQRAEVAVQTGNGTIIALSNKDDDARQNVMVEIKSDNHNVKHSVKSWLGKSDPLYPNVVAAFEAKRMVEYRVEAQRKSGVDRATPIAALRPDTKTAGENTKAIFAGMDGVLSTEAVTNPKEDPMTGGRIPATSESAAPASAATPTTGAPVAVGVDAALRALATARTAGLPGGVIDAACALALAAGASAEQVTSVGFAGDKDAGVNPVRRAHAREAAPYLARNTDERVNLGSYAMQAAFGAERVAHDLIADVNLAAFGAHNAGVADGSVEGETKDAPEAVDFGQAASLGAVLLSISDEVQVGAYGGGRADRMATSHTRARSLVYDAIKNRHAVPFGASEGDRDTWRQAVVAEGVFRFRSLVALSGIEQGPEPDASAPAPQAQERQAPPAQQVQVRPSPAVQAAPAQAPAQNLPRPKPPVAGEDGFIAADDAIVARFSALAGAAGFTASPDTPVRPYLVAKFGVRSPREVHGSALSALVTWYSERGESGARLFRDHVSATAPAPVEQAAA